MNGFTMDMTSAVVTTIDLGPWQPSLNLIQGWLLTCGLSGARHEIQNDPAPFNAKLEA
jgi:hypothetical protein